MADGRHATHLLRHASEWLGLAPGVGRTGYTLGSQLKAHRRLQACVAYALARRSRRCVREAFGWAVADPPCAVAELLSIRLDPKHGLEPRPALTREICLRHQSQPHGPVRSLPLPSSAWASPLPQRRPTRQHALAHAHTPAAPPPSATPCSPQAQNPCTPADPTCTLQAQNPRTPTCSALCWKSLPSCGTSRQQAASITSWHSSSRYRSPEPGRKRGRPGDTVTTGQHHPTGRHPSRKGLCSYGTLRVPRAERPLTKGLPQWPSTQCSAPTHPRPGAAVPQGASFP